MVLKVNFALDHTICVVKGDILPMTPQTVASEKNFFKCPNIATRAAILGVWKTKSYLKDFFCFIPIPIGIFYTFVRHYYYVLHVTCLYISDYNTVGCLMI